MTKTTWTALLHKDVAVHEDGFKAEQQKQQDNNIKNKICSMSRYPPHTEQTMHLNTVHADVTVSSVNYNFMIHIIVLEITQ